MLWLWTILIVLALAAVESCANAKWTAEEM